MSFEGRVRIDGHYTGRVYSEDLLELGEGGTLVGEADVARAVIAGTVEGRLRVRQHLLLMATAKVVGKIDVGVLELRRGARLEAEVRVTGEATE